MNMFFYAAASKDENNVNASSSGGVFFELSKEIISRNGVVYGATQVTPGRVIHIRTDNVDDVEKLRKSKYVRSEISCFNEVIHDLEEGKWVLFSGTGCQINGLYKFLKGQPYDHLLTIEVVCHGVPIKKAYDKYLELTTKEHGSNICDIDYRDKRFGWENNAICEKFENGEQEVCLSTDHINHNLYLLGINMERGCSYCKYARLPRIADISLADFWKNNGEFIPTKRKLGISLVVVSSDKGKNIFECIKKSLYVKEVPREDAVASCRHLTQPPTLHVNQKAFEKLIGYVDYRIAAELCTSFGMVCDGAEVCVLGENEINEISVSKKLYINGQEIIYVCDNFRRIKGIVSLGAFIDACINEKQFINTNFKSVCITDKEIVNNIKTVFGSNEKVLRIPIVDNDNRILFEVRRNHTVIDNNDKRRWILPFIAMKADKRKMYYFKRPDFIEGFSYTVAQKKRMNGGLSFPVMAGNLKQYEADLKGIMHSRYSEKYVEDLQKVSEIVKKGNRYCHIDECSELVNVIDGKRVVCFKPDDYLYKIHIYGRCGVFGYAVEDGENLPSQLQKLVKEKKVLVINHGTWGAEDKFIFDNLMEDLSDGTITGQDMVLFYMGTMPFVDKAEKLGLYINDTTDVFHRELKNEKVNFYDIPGHMNAEGYNVISGYIFNELKSDFEVQCIRVKSENQSGYSQSAVKKENETTEISEYISKMSKLLPMNKFVDKQVGAAVMNCNPFTKGHRYLIEMAAKDVDFFIVFVVEEDKSDFSFEDRFEMVKLGTKDIENVYVIPSGKYVLSTYTMPEYFFKSQEKARVVDMSKDLEIFADYIAPAFNITRRYVGEEPFDNITNMYNQEQKRLLKSKGIEVIEISRLQQDGEVVSATKARKLLSDNDIDALDLLLPSTTLEYLKSKKPKMCKNRTEKIFIGNNKIICNEEKLEGCTINWHGENSCIKIGDKFVSSDLVIDVYSNVNVNIGDNAEIHKGKWVFNDQASCNIGNGFSWGNSFDETSWDDGGEMYISDRAIVSISDDVHLNKTDLMVVYADSSLRIGKETMFARHVTIRTGDGHPIFDKNSGAQINTTAGNVVIGNHVWLTEHVTVLGNSVIGDGSVIGANSLIKGDVPENCLFAGTAGNAKVIKENIEWRR